METTTDRVTFRGNRDDGWDVTVNGQHVGRVMASWSRTHGNCYRAFYPAHTNRQPVDYHTRRDAAAALRRAAA